MEKRLVCGFHGHPFGAGPWHPRWIQPLRGNSLDQQILDQLPPEILWTHLKKSLKSLKFCICLYTCTMIHSLEHAQRRGWQVFPNFKGHKIQVVLFFILYKPLWRRKQTSPGKNEMLPILPTLQPLLLTLSPRAQHTTRRSDATGGKPRRIEGRVHGAQLVDVDFRRCTALSMPSLSHDGILSFRGGGWCLRSLRARTRAVQSKAVLSKPYHQGFGWNSVMREAIQSAKGGHKNGLL